VAKKAQPKKSALKRVAAAQPKRVATPPAPPAPKPWKVVLTKLVSEHATEAQARAAFTSASRGLRIGDRLVLVKDKT
jgi:hypothetical protein